jgi:hypothetical protein
MPNYRCPQYITFYQQAGPWCFDAAMKMMMTALGSQYADLPNGVPATADTERTHSLQYNLLFEDWAAFEPSFTQVIQTEPIVATLAPPATRGLGHRGTGHAVLVSGVNTDTRTVFYVDPNFADTRNFQEMQLQDFALRAKNVIYK